MESLLFFFACLLAGSTGARVRTQRLTQHATQGSLDWQLVIDTSKYRIDSHSMMLGAVDTDSPRGALMEALQTLEHWRAILVMSSADSLETPFAQGRDGMLFKIAIPEKCNVDEQGVSSVIVKLSFGKYPQEDIVALSIQDIAASTGSAVPVHAYAIGGRHAVAVMPTYDGDLLGFLQNKLDVDWQDATTIVPFRSVVAQLASGLSALHGKGVLPIDVKLQNVLYKCLPGRPEVCRFDYTDFGGSCAQTTCINWEFTVGTLQYMPPSALRALKEGKPVKSPVSISLYALGLMVYELVVLEPAVLVKDLTPETAFREALKLPGKVAQNFADAGAPPALRDAVLGLIQGTVDAEEKPGILSQLPCYEGIAAMFRGQPVAKPYDVAMGKAALQQLRNWADEALLPERPSLVELGLSLGSNGKCGQCRVEKGCHSVGKQKCPSM